MARLASALLIVALRTSATRVYFSNIVPRLDSNGAILDAHDGVILRDPSSGHFLYFGMGYGPCKETPGWGCEGMWVPPHCGFLLNHSISLYTSPDLSPNGSWTLVRDILPMGSRPDAVYFRPQVVFNAQTSKWVLWVNAVPLKDGIADYSVATYVVATADRPEAQFTVVANSTATRYGGGLGDLALFVDPRDGAGYVAYAAWGAALHSVSVERLTDDYLASAAAARNDSALSSGPIGPSMQEAPLLFERGGTYYLTAGHTCCFCPEGAASLVWSAPAPLGPWTERVRCIARRCGACTYARAWTLLPLQGYIDPPSPAGGHAGLLGAQNSILVAVPIASGSGGATTTTTLVWAADRWLSATDGLKGHDFQYWAPLVWNDSAVPAVPEPLAWVDGFWLDVNATASSMA